VKVNQDFKEGHKPLCVPLSRSLRTVYDGDNGKIYIKPSDNFEIFKALVKDKTLYITLPLSEIKVSMIDSDNDFFFFLRAKGAKGSYYCSDMFGFKLTEIKISENNDSYLSEIAEHCKLSPYAYEHRGMVKQDPNVWSQHDGGFICKKPTVHQGSGTIKLEAIEDKNIHSASDCFIEFPSSDE